MCIYVRSGGGARSGPKRGRLYIHARCIQRARQRYGRGREGEGRRTCVFVALHTRERRRHGRWVTAAATVAGGEGWEEGTVGGDAARLASKAPPPTTSGHSNPAHWRWRCGGDPRARRREVTQTSVRARRARIVAGSPRARPRRTSSSVRSTKRAPPGPHRKYERAATAVSHTRPFGAVVTTASRYNIIMYRRYQQWLKLGGRKGTQGALWSSVLSLWKCLKSVETFYFSHFKGFVLKRILN